MIYIATGDRSNEYKFHNSFLFVQIRVHSWFNYLVAAMLRKVHSRFTISFSVQDLYCGPHYFAAAQYAASSFMLLQKVRVLMPRNSRAGLYFQSV